MTAREAALLVLIETEQKGAYLNLALKKQLGESSLSAKDKALAGELVYGTVQNKIRIDYVISRFSKLKPSKISTWIFNILRIGVYQLLFLDKIPPSAAVNEAVKLSRRYGHAASAGFANGILRNIAKNKDKISYPPKKPDFAEYLSVFYSCAPWMAEYFIKKFGKEGAEDFFSALNRRTPLTVRVNTLKTTAEQLMQRLEQEGVTANSGTGDFELVLSNSGNIEALSCYQEGLFYVQDTAAMLTGLVADPKPGDRVCDLCAAPGGKATHMAELMENKGEVFAFDIYAHKAELIRENAARLGTTCVKATLADATEKNPAFISGFDCVVCDVPCMGLGIMGRKPDIKYTKSQSDLEEILPLQQKILNNGAAYVKPGGSLIYSTCSLCDEENREQIELFLKSHPDFKPEDFSSLIPEKFKPETEGMLELYPHIHQTDGFFIAKLRRR